MLHTSILPYANRDRILARLVALFLLLSTTSGDILWLKFGGVWETLWIFKVVIWPHDRWRWNFILWDLNCKFGSVSYCGHQQTHRASSLEIQTGNFCKVGYPVGTLKPDIQMRTFLTWDFLLMLLFLSEENRNLLDTQEHCIRKLGKIRSELKLMFGV